MMARIIQTCRCRKLTINTELRSQQYEILEIKETTVGYASTVNGTSTVGYASTVNGTSTVGYASTVNGTSTVGYASTVNGTSTVLLKWEFN